MAHQYKRVIETKRLTQFCDTARDLALSSKMKFRHSTLVIYKGSIIAFGINSRDRCYLKGRVIPSMHSEMQALINTGNINGRKVDLIVCRYTRDLQPKSSRPCNLCLQTLEDFEHVCIRKIYYFDNDGALACEHFKHMKHVHQSTGWKNLISNCFK